MDEPRRAVPTASVQKAGAHVLECPEGFVTSENAEDCAVLNMQARAALTPLLPSVLSLKREQSRPGILPSGLGRSFGGGLHTHVGLHFSSW